MNRHSPHIVSCKNEKWDELTKVQKQGIIDAINELDSGKGIPHKKIIKKYRKKNSYHF